MHCNYDDLYRVRDNRHSRLICSHVFAFFFLSIVANVKFFFRGFSGTVKVKSLKDVMQCIEDDLYRVRDKGLSWHICSSVRFFLLIQASCKFFVKDFSGTIKASGLKLGMQCNYDDLHCLRDNGLSRFQGLFVYLFFHFSFSPYRPMLNVL